MKIQIKLVIAFFLVWSGYLSASVELGSVVIYSNGQVEKLLESNSQWSLWEDARKRVYRRSNLPVLPVLEYRRFSFPESGYTQTVRSGNPNAIKPYGESNEVDFSIARVDVLKGPSEKHWTCEYLGLSTFKYRKENLQTVEYRCQRFSRGGYSPDKLKEDLRFSYSPKLGLIVNKDRVNAKGRHSNVSLVRVLSPEKATAKRISRIVYKQLSK